MISLCSLFSWCVQELWLGIPQTFSHLANSVNAWDSAAKVLKALKVMWWRVQEEQQCKILEEIYGVEDLVWAWGLLYPWARAGYRMSAQKREEGQGSWRRLLRTPRSEPSHLVIPWDCSFQRAWFLDVKRALNPSWTSPVSPNCTNGHTASWDKSVGHSDVSDDCEFGTCVLVVVTRIWYGSSGTQAGMMYPGLSFH